VTIYLIVFLILDYCKENEPGIENGFISYAFLPELMGYNRDNCLYMVLATTLPFVWCI